MALDGGIATAKSIVAIASRQHGVVARSELLKAGLGRDAIDNRVKAGFLRPVYRGVYSVIPAAGPHSREMAAVLACGRRAVLSHRAAVALWQLLPYPATHVPIDITVSGTDRGRRQRGIRVHRVGSLSGDEITHLKGIPITTPTRTLLDVAPDVTSRELEQAITKAERERLTSRTKLAALLARNPRRRGAPAVRTLLGSRGRAAFTRSEAEERLLALIRRAQLPEPELNVKLGAYEVDFLWPAQCVIVEVDGYAYHSGRHEFERDRAKDAALAASGFLVVRITWRQLVHEAEAVVARIAATLAVRGPSAAEAGAPGAGR